MARNVSAAWIDKCRVTAREVKLGQRYDQLLTHIREAFGQQCHAIRMRLNNDDMPCHDLSIDESLTPPLPTGPSPHWSAPNNWYSWPTSTADSITAQMIRLSRHRPRRRDLGHEPVETDQDSDARENAPSVSRFRYPAQS